MAKLVNSENLAQALQGVHGKAKTMYETEKGLREAADTALDNRVKTLEGKFTGEGEGTVAAQINAAKQEALAAAGAAQTDVNNLEKLVGQIPEGASSTTIAGYVDEKVGAEQTRAEGAEAGLLAEINALKGEGSGSVAGQIATAKQELQEKIDDAQEAADAAQATAEAAQAAANKAQGEVDAVELRVATLEAIDHDAYKAADAEVLDAAKKHADNAITALVNGAPDAMNTLNELADAIEKHQGVYETYVETVTANIATAKQAAIDAAKTETTNQVSAAKTELQGKIDAASDVADAAKAQANTNKNAIATLNGDANTEGSVAAKIKAQADTQAAIDEAQDGKITTLEGEMDTVQGKVSTLETDMDKAQQDITNLDAADDALSGRITELEEAVAEGGSVSSQIGAVNTALENYKTAQKATDDKQDEAIAAAKTQADKGVADAAAAKTQADKGVQDAANAQAAANAAQSDATKALADAAAASTAAANALTDAKKYADAQDGVLKAQVVGTFNALDLVEHEGKVKVALGTGRMEDTSTPLGNGIEFMTDEDVKAILAGLE